MKLITETYWAVGRCDKRGEWKSRQCHPTLAGPKQANRKAGPGEVVFFRDAFASHGIKRKTHR